MPVINLTEPFTIILCLAAIICAIYLGHEIKRAIVPAIAFNNMHYFTFNTYFQLFVFTSSYLEYEKILSTSIIFDFGFVLLTYLAYLWVDDIEAKNFWQKECRQYIRLVLEENIIKIIIKEKV